MYALQVEGMSCAHCVAKVTRAVRQIDAAATVDIHLATKTARIESTADVDQLCAAITEAGFPAAAAKD